MDALQKLPHELIIHILSLSSAKDILSCAACCHRLNDLIDTSSELQLIIELAVQGLRLRNYTISAHHDGHQASAKHAPSAVERLNILRESTQARQTLRPFTTAAIPLEGYEYEICEGVFGHALKDDENRFRGLEFQKLWIEEDADGKKECSTWRRYEDFGIDLADFSFDLSEDVLVLVEDPPFSLNMHTKILKNIHIFTLSERTPHPLAESGYLQSPGEEPWYQCDIKICGPILGILFAFPHQIARDHGRLSIWNWKTGELIYTSGAVGGYAFLSQNTILVLLLAEDDESEEEPITQGVMQIEIIRLFDSLGPSNSPPTLTSRPNRIVLSLPLNTLPDGVYVFSDKPLADSNTLPSDVCTTPYTLDETSERIVVLQFLTWNHYVFISTRHLLRLLDSAPMPSPLTPQQPVPWDGWGPDGSFWMSGPHLQCGYTSVLGARFCAISAYQNLFHTDQEGNITRDEMDTSRVEDEAHLRMLMLDFNKRPIIRGRTREGSDDSGMDAVPEDGEQPLEESADGSTSDEGDGQHPDDAERAMRRLGRIDVESGSTALLFGMSSGGQPGEWACFSPHTQGMVLSRLPFRAFQREDVQGYLDWIVGMDHLVGISREPNHTYDVMQFTRS